MELPGLNRYPDLAASYRREMARAGCSGCDRAAVIRKYQDKVAQRDAGERSQNILETARR